MSLFKFDSNDLFFNELKTHPQSEFIIHSGNVYYNRRTKISGAHTSSVPHVPVGHLSLYELNVDRSSDQLIYPFITKEGSLTAFRTVSCVIWELSLISFHGERIF